MSATSKRHFPFNEQEMRNGGTKKYKVEKATMSEEHISLVEKMRPTNFVDYIGQKHLLGDNSVLQELLEKGQIASMILWGPPGCGKTSLVNVISHSIKEITDNKIHVVSLLARTSGINDIRKIVTVAKNEFKLGKKTIVVMDEIHRFNKLQQDIFLPHVELGTFTLIGTTTENPSYSLNSALLSRCRVFVLNKLTVSDVIRILQKAIDFMEGTRQNEKPSYISVSKLNISKDTLKRLAEICDGDARVALNSLEISIKSKPPINTMHGKTINISFNDIENSLKQVHILCDKETNHNHHLYSALHKSIQAGKSNAALYWLARIMEVKENPVDIARRLVRISSEDIGLADPDALGVAVHTMHGCQMIGMPECDVILAQCTVYLTKAPKSRLIFNALRAAEKVISDQRGSQPPVPLHLKYIMGQYKLEASCDNFIQNEEDNKSFPLHNLPYMNFFTEAV